VNPLLGGLQLTVVFLSGGELVENTLASVKLSEVKFEDMERGGMQLHNGNIIESVLVVIVSGCVEVLAPDPTSNG